MSVPIDAFLLDPSLIQTLKLLKFVQLRDFDGFDAQRLFEITKLDSKTCVEILDEVHRYTSIAEVKPYSDILAEELKLRPITSLNKNLDDLLNGGFPLHKIVEIYGAASSGKTQLCMQLCVNAVVPPAFGGNGAEAVFIDCESLKVSRFNEIATLTVNELREKFMKTATFDELASFNSKNITDGLSILVCKSAAELRTAILHKLEPFLDERPKVNIIVIDSISYHFRYGYEDDFYERTKILLEISQKLKAIASHRDVCIIFTNHLTHKVDVNKDVPSLGASWSHCCNIRLLLERDNDKDVRFISATKNFPQKGKCQFTISAAGFR